MNTLPNPPRSLAAIWVSACIVGAILSPLGYIAIGALAAFAPLFSVVMLPPLAIATGWLLYRNLFGKLPHCQLGRWHHAANCLAWGMTALFLSFISGFSLFKPLERFGILGTIYLAAVTAALPLVWTMRTRRAIAPTWMHSPISVAMTILACSTAGAAAIAYAVQTTTLY